MAKKQQPKKPAPRKKPAPKKPREVPRVKPEPEQEKQAPAQPPRRRCVTCGAEVLYLAQHGDDVFECPACRTQTSIAYFPEVKPRPQVEKKTQDDAGILGEDA